MLRRIRHAGNPAGNPDWMEPWCACFVEGLAEQGYAQDDMYADRRIARNTFAAVRARGLDATAVDATVARSPCRLPLEGSSKQTQALWQGIAAGFLDCLSESGVIDLPEPEDPPRPGSLEYLRREHEGWLRGQRGLSAGTIRGHSKVFERFMRFRFGDARICPGPITVPDIWRNNFRREAANAVLRTQGWHRGLLRYLHATGWNRDDLSWCVARLAHNRPPLSRTLLSANDIQRVRDAARGDTDQARRDYAILLLTARLGLRAPEVVAIRLDDIRWHRGGILICGKGNLHDALPLPVGVGEALADYVRQWPEGIVLPPVRLRACAQRGTSEYNDGRSAAAHSDATGRIGAVPRTTWRANAPPLPGDRDAVRGRFLR